MTQSPYAGDAADRAAPEDVVVAKNALRAQSRRSRREQVPGRDRAADATSLAVAVLAFLDDLPQGNDQPTVAAYESFPTEPPTEEVVAALRQRGSRVLLPITLGDNDLDWFDAADESREPLGTGAILAAELVLVPASGVDAAGGRLGRGGGSYDRALSRVRCQSVAIVWPWEVLESRLPTQAHDRPVDAVLAPGSPVRRLG